MGVIFTETPKPQIETLFPRPSVNFLLGPYASKKTWLALDLAISIAAGHPWLGLAAQQVGAVHIDYALDPDLKERIRALLIAHKWPEKLPVNFGRESFLHGPQDIDSLLADLLPLKAGFIVLDSLLGPRLELNARQAPFLAPYLVSLKHLSKETDAAILVLHDLRSHRTNLGSALVAMGVDHVLAAESQFGDDRVHLRTLASANGTHIAVNARVQHSRHSAHLSLSSSTPPCQLGTLGKRLLWHLQEYGQATTAQLVSSFPHSSPKRISNLIQELLTDGYIYRSNSGGRGIPAIYQLTPAGYQVISKAPLSSGACPERSERAGESLSRVSHSSGDEGGVSGVRGITSCQTNTIFKAPLSSFAGEGLGVRGISPRQVSTSCQVSTTPAPASEDTSKGSSASRSCEEGALAPAKQSQVYNPGSQNPFVLQRKPCSE
jgi:hypothetical protein